MEKHLTENKLKEFTSNIKYSYFDDGKGNCGDIDFHSEIINDLIPYPNLRSISWKFAKALCYIYDNKVNHPNDFDKELCSYLYYWIGDKIYSNLNDKRVFSKLIRMFFDVLNENYDYDICDTPETKIDESTFKNNKLLFDYSKNHVNIDHHTVYGDTTCDKKYKDVLQNYINIYKDAYANCTGNGEKRYECDKYSDILNEGLYPKLSTFSCIHDENGRAVFERQGRPEKQETPLAHHYTPPRVMSSVKHPPTVVGPILTKHTSSRSPEDPGSIEALSIGDTTEGGSSKTIAGSVAPVLGVSSISLLLYKVTPLGGFIRNFLGRNRNMHNPVEYMDSFNPYSDGMIPGDRTMNISYQRL